MDLTQDELQDNQRASARPPYWRILGGVGAVGLIIALVIWLMPWLQPYAYHGTILQATERVQEFELDTSAGQPMRLSDFRGKYLLLYFGYSFCPDVCPLTLSDLKSAVGTLGEEAEQIQVLFITLDPARDTVTQLASYLPHFDPDFLGMTGDPETILRVATQFGIFYEAHKEAESDYYTVDHTSTVIVVDPEGYARLVFPYGITGAEMAEDLQHLMR